MMRIFGNTSASAAMQVRDEETHNATGIAAELPEIRESKEDLLKNTKNSNVAAAEQSLINIANTQPEKVINQYMVEEPQQTKTIRQKWGAAPTQPA